MKKEFKNKFTYIKWMTDSIAKIENYTSQLSFEDFEKDEKTIDACLMQFQHLWETTKKLQQISKEDIWISFEEIIWMRNYIAHDYLWIEIFTIWSTIKEDLPILKKLLQKQLDNWK